MLATQTHIAYGDESYTIERLATSDALLIERVIPPGPKFTIPMKWLAQSTDLPTVYAECVQASSKKGIPNGAE
jgi:hypothetical protein